MYIFHYSTTIPSGFSAVGHPFEVGAKGIPTVTDVTDRLEKKMAMREAVISAKR